MMIFRILERMFNIDDIDCKWGVRFMFLFCVVARCAVFFNPYSDTDFTWLNTWISNFESAQTTEQLPAAIPITSGNIVFLVTAFLALFITLMMGILYSGLYVRYFRIKKMEKEAEAETEGTSGTEEPQRPGALIKRLLLLTLFYLAVSLPFMLISSNFLLFFCIGFPFLFTAPACYLSGDKGMFNSLPYVVKLTRGFYTVHVRSLVVIVLMFFFTDALAGLTSFFSNTTFYILSSAFSTWITFTFGRYAGMAYCAMKERVDHPERNPEKEGKIG